MKGIFQCVSISVCYAAMETHLFHLRCCVNIARCTIIIPLEHRFFSRQKLFLRPIKQSNSISPKIRSIEWWMYAAVMAMVVACAYMRDCVENNESEWVNDSLQTHQRTHHNGFRFLFVQMQWKFNVLRHVRINLYRFFVFCLVAVECIYAFNMEHWNW